MLVATTAANGGWIDDVSVECESDGCVPTGVSREYIGMLESVSW